MAKKKDKKKTAKTAKSVKASVGAGRVKTRKATTKRITGKSKITKAGGGR